MRLNRKNFKIQESLSKLFIFNLIFIFLFSTFCFAGQNKIKMPPKKSGWAFRDEMEFDALPIFCKARFYPPKSEFYQQWERKIGGDFIHIHHFCRGLTLFNRAKMEFDPKKRKATSISAAKEMNYTIKHISRKVNKKFYAWMLKKKSEAEILITGIRSK